ncbi:unnamed protein product [Fusarium venenatum]|uniref:Major facilitator superfamily (MFS) profile domain-containing protein n=1 Tax=Fusarium venenatum TaxID=56646 RepID=A0A2L2SQ31_9HYPO|nr:uncharacterized protein FVRRES_12775 [Fusarium venenatum]CEI40084.1 unnamed protein product [Fusarium venenatum]
MSRSNNGRLASLKQRLEAFLERQIHERDEFGNSLAGVSEPDLRKGIDALCTELLSLERFQVERVAEVAKNGNYYYRLSKGLITNLSPVVELTQDEKDNLVSERERLFSQRGMLSIICTVSLAAFLQGHVQSSINAMSLFVETVGIDIENQGKTQENGADNIAQWQLGAMNAIPFLTAAFPGAPLSLPVNYCLGRRGALGLSALLIIASSIGSAFAKTWQQVLGARIVGGIAMGIKAVSAPILASETAVGYWRGSTILAWQLWVACGIMIGFVANFIISAATNTLDGKPNAEHNQQGGRYHALQWIAAAPAIPSLLLFIAVCYCYESPRFYMRPDTPNYNLGRAFDILLQVRKTKLQATRDLFLIWWSSEEGRAVLAEPHKNHNEETIHQDHRNAENADGSRNSRTASSGLTYSSLIFVVMKLSADQFKPLFTRRRLRNALWSSCTVALAQQLCGNGIFSDYGVRTSMAYSFGFGCVNFFFGLLAMRSIDIIGRRRWLLSTLPVMSLFLMAATIAYAIGPQDTTGGQSRPEANTSAAIAGIIFIYPYSPGLGPIPFTLASESFPLKHREAGASVAISINLFFAGLLTILLPRINAQFKIAGTLGFFAGLNVVAFVLIFFFVEETKQLTLEELDQVFDNPKRQFVNYQMTRRLPFLSRKYLLWKDAERPQAYDEWALENRQGSDWGGRD